MRKGTPKSGTWRKTFCRTRVVRQLSVCRLAFLTVLILGLLPHIGIAQQEANAPVQPSPNFVRQGDRLLRTRPAPSTMTLTEGEEYEFEVVDEAALPDSLGQAGDSCAIAVPHAGDCLGSCCVDLQERGASLLLPLFARCGMDPGGWWIRAEALVWWVDGYQVPALVTTSPFGTERDAAGELGQPTTTILYGHEDLDASTHPGGRVRLGYWFDARQTHGLEAAYFGLAQQSSTFHADSTHIAILARPIFNVEPSLVGADAELVAFPGLAEGQIQVHHQTQMQGFEAFYRQALCQKCDRRVDWLVGYRYLNLDEELVVSDSKRIVTGDTGLQLGTTLEEFDRFATRNEFHGVQVGMMTGLRRNRWSLEVLGKVALGRNHSQVAINGSTTVTVPDPDTATTPYGLLALASNSGTHTRDSFTLIPELGVTLGYDLTSCLRATLGYTLLYWGEVARPGEQIDLDVNLSQVPPNIMVGTARPEFRWVGSDLWVQGFSAGLHYRF